MVERQSTRELARKIQNMAGRYSKEGIASLLGKSPSYIAQVVCYHNISLARRYTKWTKERTGKLICLHQTGMTARTIATEIGCTKMAIHDQIFLLKQKGVL